MAKGRGERPPRGKKDEEARQLQAVAEFKARQAAEALANTTDAEVVPSAPDTAVGAALADALKKVPNWKPGQAVAEADPVQTWEGEGGRATEEREQAAPSGAFNQEELRSIIDEAIQNIPDTVPPELREIFGDRPVPAKVFENFKSLKRKENKQPEKLKRFLANVKEAQARVEERRAEKEKEERRQKRKKKEPASHKKDRINLSLGQKPLEAEAQAAIDAWAEAVLPDTVPPDVRQHEAEEQAEINTRIPDRPAVEAAPAPQVGPGQPPAAEDAPPAREPGFPNFLKVLEAFYNPKKVPPFIQNDFNKLAKKLDDGVEEGTEASLAAEEKMREFFVKMAIPLNDLESRDLPKTKIKAGVEEKKPFRFPAHETGRTSTARVIQKGSVGDGAPAPAPAPEVAPATRPAPRQTPAPKKVSAAEASKPAPTPRPEGVKKSKTYSFDEVKDIFSEQLASKAKVDLLDISKTDEGLQLRAELDAGFAGGKIKIEGIIVNSGKSIALQGLKIEARGYVKSMIENGLTSFGDTVKARLEERYGKSISSIQIADAGIIVESETSSSALEPGAPAAEPKPEAPAVAAEPVAAKPAEGTRGELVKGLRESVAKLVEMTKEKVEWWKSSEEHLIRRSAELDAQLDKMGRVERGFRWLGEKYNKAGWKTKLGVGVALGLGAGISAPVSMTAAAACLSGIAAQRIAALATMYLKYEKNALSGDKWGKEKAMAKAIVYTAAMTAGTMYAVEKVSESDWAQQVREWFGNTFGSRPAPQAQVPEAAGPRVGFQAEVRAVDNAIPEAAASVPAAPETPSINVEVKAGKGAEWMMKRVWEQLQENGVDPSKYADKPDSDIYKLLNADASSIDKVVHDIASDPNHKFYNPDGSSVRVGLGSHMTIGADGQVRLNGMLQAPEGAPTTGFAEGELPAGPGSPIKETVEYIGRDYGTDSPIEDGTKPSAPVEQPPTPTPEPPSGAAEQAQPPESPPQAFIEHTKEFLNQNKLAINPLEGHVFQDSSGAALAYGNDFAARFEAAQEFAKANPDTSVWVQAEKPVFYQGAWRPWVMEVRYGGSLWRHMQILNPDGPPDVSHLGPIRPDTFIKQLDK